MSIASLANKRIEIQRRTETVSSWGGPKLSWSTVKKSRARVQPLTGQDTIVHGKPDLRLTHRLYFPGKPDVQAGDRLKVGTRDLFVVSIRDIDELGRLLTVDCEERDAF